MRVLRWSVRTIPTPLVASLELLDALDSAIPDPLRATDRPFLMPVEGVHTIEGRGTVATGKVEQGTITPGTRVEILGLGDDVLQTVVTSVEQFNRALDRADAGQNVGLLLRGVKADQLRRGQVVAAPRSLSSRTGFPRRGVRAGQGRGGAGTRRSSAATARSSSSGPAASPARSACRRISRWSCPAITRRWT